MTDGVLLYMLTIAMLLCGLMIGLGVGSHISKGNYEPILEVEEDRILIECEDESTDWVKLPKCEE